MRVQWDGSNGIMEIVIRNEFGEKIAHFKTNLRDGRRINEIAKTLREKYDLDLSGKDLFDF